MKKIIFTQQNRRLEKNVSYFAFSDQNFTREL